MTETHTPEPPKPITDAEYDAVFGGQAGDQAASASSERITPTHIVEVYLEGGDRVFGNGARIERYFYESEAAADVVYKLLHGMLRLKLERSNDLPLTSDIGDLYGRGVVVLADLKGARLLHHAALEDWVSSAEALRAGKREASRVFGRERAIRSLEADDEEAADADAEAHHDGAAGHDHLAPDGGL